MPSHVVQVAAELVEPVVAVDLHRVRLPLREPFVAAHGTEVDREVVLVQVRRASGAVGWGECVALSAPTYTAEHTDGAWRVLADELVPAALEGRSLDVGAWPMAWTAVDAALLDARLVEEDRSLAAHLGATRATVECTAVVGGQASVDDVVRAVAARVDEGYGTVKLKVRPGDDAEPLDAVRRTWPSLTLAADANGSYADDPEAVRALEPFDLAYLEQPNAAGDLAGAAWLRARHGIPLALDESITDVATFERAARVGALDLVNVKPGRVGGLATATALVRAAQDAGIGAFVGGMLETGVGRATALAVAGLEACTEGTDLGPSTRYFTTDLTDAIELVEGARLAVPTGPGIGVRPDPARLAAATVDHVRLAAGSG